MGLTETAKRANASPLADLAKRLYTPRNVSAGLLLCDALLCAAIIRFVACECFRHGSPSRRRSGC